MANNNSVEYIEENKTLKDIVYDLDWDLCGISYRLETLDDLSITLEHLRQEMEEKGQGNAMLYYREWSRTVRIVDELLRCSLKDLSSGYKKISAASGVIFKKVVKDESVLEKGQKPSINSVDGWNWFGMSNNIEVFMKEFGRMPESFEEVATHISNTVEKVRTLHEVKKTNEQLV